MKEMLIDNWKMHNRMFWFKTNTISTEILLILSREGVVSCKIPRFIWTFGGKETKNSHQSKVNAVFLKGP
jgi:hypothetical protein